MQTIKTIARKRFNSCKKRCINLNIPLPLFTDFLHLFETSEGICHYCNAKLLLQTDYPHYFSYSVDHKLPLTQGGSNHPDNLIVCCHRCNIIKGTMNYATYTSLLEKINKDENILNEMFWGSRQNKIVRLHSEKKEV